MRVYRMDLEWTVKSHRFSRHLPSPLHFYTRSKRMSTHYHNPPLSPLETVIKAARGVNIFFFFSSLIYFLNWCIFRVTWRPVPLACNALRSWDRSMCLFLATCSFQLRVGPKRHNGGHGVDWLKQERREDNRTNIYNVITILIARRII